MYCLILRYKYVHNYYQPYIYIYIYIYLFSKEDYIRNSTKTTLLTKYIHICTMYIPTLPHMQTLYIIRNEFKTLIKWTVIEESSSTYIRWLSKINANILGI